MKNKRFLELDALRGIAALFVLLFHYTVIYNEGVIDGGSTSSWKFSFGHYGVQLFFIISGFVIFMSINHMKNPLEFLYKRFIRLFPTFWFCMIITFVIIKYFGIEKYQRTNLDFVFNFTMIPALLGFKSIDGVYWSLIPELFFYLGIVIIFLASKLKRIELVILIWLLFIVIDTYFHISGLYVILNLGFGIYFIIGINFYKISTAEATFINHLLICSAVIVHFIATLSVEALIVDTLLVTLFYLVIYRKINFIAIPPLIFLGKISYAWYLIHQFIGYTILKSIDEIYPLNFNFKIIITSCITIFFAFAVTKYFEEPVIINLKKFYVKHIE